jgi:CheY-like chemotaxis protein
MVFAIVKSHGGHISCDSRPGGGAVFRLYFPAEKNEISLDPSSTQQMPAFGTETILLVEDEEPIRNFAVEILSSAGYKVLVASTGRQALEVYERAPDEISLVVLDLMMPEMGGQRCLDELLKINPSAKILIASGHPLRPSNGENWAHRAKGLVSKPYKVNHLLGAVRHALDSD